MLTLEQNNDMLYSKKIITSSKSRAMDLFLTLKIYETQLSTSTMSYDILE